MAILHPGGEALTLEAARLAGWQAGDRVLDLGCGQGDTMRLLADRLGLAMSGCDAADSMIEKCRAASLDVVKTDGVELDFPSLSFDGALAECSLSLMDRHGELLHELWCMLKPGGRLVICDLYDTSPDPERVEKNRAEAEEWLSRPRKEEDCGSPLAPSPVRLDGLFIPDLLIRLAEDTGFTVRRFLDKTRELKNFGAQILMDFGSFQAFSDSLPADARCCRAMPGKTAGYFLLLAEKRA